MGLKSARYLLYPIHHHLLIDAFESDEVVVVVVQGHLPLNSIIATVYYTD